MPLRLKRKSAARKKRRGQAFPFFPRGALFCGFLRKGAPLIETHKMKERTGMSVPVRSSFLKNEPFAVPL